MNRSLPPFIVQLLGAASLIVGLYLALRGRPGSGQIMLIGGGLLSTPTAIRAIKDRYATLPPPEDDELERYREERRRAKAVREKRKPEDEPEE